MLLPITGSPAAIASANTFPNASSCGVSTNMSELRHRRAISSRVRGPAKWTSGATPRSSASARSSASCGPPPAISSVYCPARQHAPGAQQIRHTLALDQPRDREAAQR